MLSPNLAVKLAYFQNLSGILYLGDPVKVFWGQLPTTIATGLYIIVSSIRNNDVSTKSSSDTQTSVTVSIYTNSPKYNDGVAVEAVANEVLNRIYRNSQFNIQLNNTFFQCIKTELTSDQTNDFSQNNQLVYIDRILVFNHLIFQNPS